MSSIISFIHTPTSNLEVSKSFYQRLAFKTLASDDAILFTDGISIFEINPDRYARAGIKCFKADWSSEIEQLKALTTIIDIEGGHMCNDPNGVRIYLMNTVFEKPDLPGKPISTLGNGAGLSIESTDLNKTTTFWKILGYELTMGSPEQGWMGFSNGSGVDVSVMKAGACPHLFFNPSLSYFNGKNNMDIIQKIRDAEVPITEEITFFNKEGIVDNVIIRDPGGLGFFIFSD